MSRSLSRIALAFTLLLAALWWTTGPVLPVHAASTQQVSSCDLASLNNAISAAGVGGTVQFTQDCTITLSRTITIGQNVTIDGNGHKVTISGGGAVQVFMVNSAVTAALNDLTIANGIAIGGDGGGIFNLGNLSVTNSTVSGNSAYGTVGGAVPIGGDGGGIENNGSLSVTNSTFNGNSSDGGGAIASHAAWQLTNTILANSKGGNCTIAGPFTDKGGNLADDSTCGVTTVSTAALNVGSLADNGGPSQTIVLGAGSVAIGAAHANCPSARSGSLIRNA